MKKDKSQNLGFNIHSVAQRNKTTMCQVLYWGNRNEREQYFCLKRVYSVRSNTCLRVYKYNTNPGVPPLWNEELQVIIKWGKHKIGLLLEEQTFEINLSET